ncbi:hypothetical protein RB653_002265 [Dictyostelium firmibasis]|uniref:Uncharacterized protein n=1 Tax=Dictyostelium firmibasis TaxID=79012 RepID=A0AAN7YMV3_9MYCE
MKKSILNILIIFLVGIIFLQQLELYNISKKQSTQDTYFKNQTDQVVENQNFENEILVNEPNFGFSSFQFNKTNFNDNHQKFKDYIYNKYIEIYSSSDEGGVNLLNETYYFEGDSFLNVLTSGAMDITIRPDDIWSLIIKQFSYFMKLSKGQTIDYINISEDISFKTDSEIANALERAIENQIKTSFSNGQTFNLELFKPKFSTTTKSDIISILGQLVGIDTKKNNNTTSMETKQDFEINLDQTDLGYGIHLNNNGNNNYSQSFNTHIPNIRLLGCKEDYIQIKNKSQELVSNYDFGYELKIWVYNFILPVLDEFINKASDGGDGICQVFIPNTQPNSQDFWGKILDKNGKQSDSQSFIDGWITYFYYFNIEYFGDNLKIHYWLAIDSVPIQYLELKSKHLQNGYSKIPVQIINGEGFVLKYLNLISGHLVADIVDTYKFKSRLDWLLFMELYMK